MSISAGTGATDTLWQRALELDAADPLAGYRDNFVGTDTDLSYLDGNSLAGRSSGPLLTSAASSRTAGAAA